jgi:hypothetical protein
MAEGKSSSAAEEAAEKRPSPAQNTQEHPSWAEARVDFAGFMYGLKPVPFSEGSFSAACLARLIFQPGSEA